MIRINHPSIVALLETHLDVPHALRLATEIGLLGHMRVDTVGFSRGIWLYWNNNEVDVKCIKSHKQHLTIEVNEAGEEP